MPVLQISVADRKALRARAHSLHPVGSIGKAGLTPAVLQEIDRCLRSHELIKVRAGADERSQREAWLVELAQQLDAAPVQSIGRVLVLWRPHPEAAAAPAKPARGKASGRARVRRT